MKATVRPRKLRLRGHCLLGLLLGLVSIAVGQSSVAVQIMTDASTPADFGSSYPIGQLSNTAYTYGPSFILEIAYDVAVVRSLSLSVSGSQLEYQLAWRVAGTTGDNSFGAALGADVTGLSGSASSQYYRKDGTLHAQPADGTRYRIGAKATPDASKDLSVLVTVTATLY